MITQYAKNFKNTLYSDTNFTVIFGFKFELSHILIYFPLKAKYLNNKYYCEFLKISFAILLAI